MSATVLVCSDCRRSFSAEDPLWACPSCGSLLDIQLPSSALGDEARSALLKAAREPATASGVWRYAALMQVDSTNPVSLGEGNTPVVPLRAMGRQLGLPHLYAKLEFLSPTGSFKDRGTTAMVTHARALGVTRLVEDSSGNAGASFAAYCASAGIQASIYVPASAPAAKKAQIGFYGAEVVPVEGTRDAVTEAALERCRRERGAYYGSHNWNPFFLEGTKSFAYEVAAHFDFDLPEHLIMPVGNGSLFLGSWKGFGELLALGVVERLPSLHVAQATGCMPIVDALQRGLDRTEPIPTAPTVAGGISIGRPSRGHLILKGVRESGGGGAAVSDREILSFQRTLATLEGIFCEPTSAAAFAALPELVRQRLIEPEERVLVAITGMGLKDTSVLDNP
ncbi:MAG: threonine synthase [Chloroflexota bacterium]